MKTFAVDDYTEIAKFRKEIQAAEVERCPRNVNLTLYQCLRSPTRCSDECEHYNDWIGPQADG